MRPLPMLAEERALPFDSDDWIFELKHDGFRMLAARDGDHIEMWWRSGAPVGAAFPEVARALLALPDERFVLDGELVVFDVTGRPDLSIMQTRAPMTHPLKIGVCSRRFPATFCAFDLLSYGGVDLRSRPLATRKVLLESVVPPASAGESTRYVDHVPGRGVALFHAVAAMGLEGVVGKRAGSLYHDGQRSPDWLKVKVRP